MLDTLTRRLTGLFAGLGRKGRLTEDDVAEAMREIRVALLEADVNSKVAREFMARVKEKAVGEEVFASLTADQTIVRIVRDELVEMLGGETGRLEFGSRPPAVFLMCGLQGSGKTTTTAKLAKLLIKQGKKPMLAACDIQRPAAVKQLEVLGEQVGAPVFSKLDGTSPPRIAREAYDRATYLGHDVLIVDTAGRLQIDDALMDELRLIHRELKPQEVFLVLDATAGQEAVRVAEAFHAAVPATGVIFTKLDGDARGGAVLSVRSATGIPVRYLGEGEGVDALDVFHPVRTAERIIGMGDVLSIIEKAELAFEGEETAGMEDKFRSGSLDFNDMLQTFRMMKKMGPLKNILKMVPGIGQVPEEMLEQVQDADTRHIEAMILSMTPKERTNPDIINSSRRKRIARGSGRTVEEVNRLLKQFYESRRGMKQMMKLQSKAGKGGMRRR